MAMRRLRLRTLLIDLVLVATIPIALFAAWLISRSRAQQEALIDRQNIEQARAVIVAVDQEVEDVIASLNVMSLLEPIDAPDKTQFTEIAARVIPTHAHWESIRLVDLSLAVVASTRREPPGTPLTRPDWALRVIATGQPAVSHLLQEQVGGRWLVTVGIPVFRDGRVKYVLSARLYTQAFSTVLHTRVRPFSRPCRRHASRGNRRLPRSEDEPLR